MVVLVDVELKDENAPKSITKPRSTRLMAEKYAGKGCGLARCNTSDTSSPQRNPRFLRTPNLRLIALLPEHPQSIRSPLRSALPIALRKITRSRSAPQNATVLI